LSDAFDLADDLPLTSDLNVASEFPDDYNDHHNHLRHIPMNSQTHWTVAQAKAKFSEVIERAMSEGPQTVTRKGRTAVVVVDAGEWQRKTKRVGTLAEFFARSPLRGSSLKLPRRGFARKVDL
jgi:prevent-host-death family protein